MVKIKGKISKFGKGSYHIIIKKALVDAEVLKEGEYYEFKLENENAVYGSMARELQACSDFSAPFCI